MRCAWQAYLNLLPLWLRNQVDKKGAQTMQELRLRIGQLPELVCSDGIHRIGQAIKNDDILYIINVASRYSPWTAGTAAQGFLTAQGGHRIGICGAATVTNGVMTGIQSPSSLCCRVARDFPGIAKHIPYKNKSLLIIGKPGSGKTTLLRDLIRQVSDVGQETVSVVDERGELFPMVQGSSVFPTGLHVDILTGCRKADGIETVIRTMCPTYVAVDEITADRDCEALLHAGWCGVKLMATAHAGSKNDLMTRPVYRPLLEYNLFDTLLILQPDKAWKVEMCE